MDLFPQSVDEGNVFPGGFFGIATDAACIGFRLFKIYTTFFGYLRKMPQALFLSCVPTTVYTRLCDYVVLFRRTKIEWRAAVIEVKNSFSLSTLIIRINFVQRGLFLK